MFCPECGVKEERQLQYCRSCGTDLGVVRNGLSQPEGAASSVTARDEMARALAVRIQQGEWWQTQALVAEMANLFESPEERRLRWKHTVEAARLRRIRSGVITSAVGLGQIILCLLLSVLKPDLLLLAGPGVVVFLIGLAVMLNGFVFSRHKIASQKSLTAGEDGNEAPSNKLTQGFSQNDRPYLVAARTTDGLAEADPARRPFSAGSVTEQTTRHLSNEV